MLLEVKGNVIEFLPQSQREIDVMEGFKRGQSYVIAPLKRKSKYISVKQLAEDLGYHTETVYRKCRAGEIPCRRLENGKIILIREEIKRWIGESQDKPGNQNQTVKNILKGLRRR
ncbi:MAG: helix-turn-helix domain-containing protein [Nitrospinae bacterium]|jgi:excisionase family DNA binding protein|nr:helix-turn-helix domain-containing protein [Nitrospinota bacterium]